MSFLDNLENNLKALESREEGGMDESRRREAARERALSVAPWAERLKREPFAQGLMRQSVLASRQHRTKVNLAWIDTTLRLEARDHRLELRPTPEGVVAVFLHDGRETGRQSVDLSADPRKLAEEWVRALSADGV